MVEGPTLVTRVSVETGRRSCTEVDLPRSRQETSRGSGSM